MNGLPLPVSAVSFLNSLPMVYGLQKKMPPEIISLSVDVPSRCAARLSSGEVAIGLIPVVETLSIANARFISEYCIGATGAVDSVMVASTVPAAQITRIYADPHSRTSVMLARILAKHHWNIEPEWLTVSEPIAPQALRPGDAAVVIGDKTFSFPTRYRYDLAAEWLAYTGLPFVFAGWVSTKALPASFTTPFNEALAWGIAHLREAVYQSKTLPVHPETAIHYLEHFIEFALTPKKQEALQKFLTLAQNFAPLQKLLYIPLQKNEK